MGSYLPIAGAALVGAIILIAILLLSLHGSSKSAEKQKLEEAPASGGAAAAETMTEATTAALPPPTKAPRPPATKPPPRTKKATTKKTTTTTTTTTVTEPSAPEQKWLMCVFGNDTNPALVYPEDGLCDYHFYQAAEQNGSILEGKERNPSSLDAFLEAAANHSKTEDGISLDYVNQTRTMEIMFKPMSTTTIQELWQKGIYHWGFLNPPHYSTRPEEVAGAFTILKHIKEIVDRVAKPSRPHCFFFRSSFYQDHIMFRRDWNMENFRNNFWVDAFVILTHQDDDDRSWVAGRIVAPTFFFDLEMPDTEYKYNLDSGHATLDFLSKEELNGTLMYLTASMGARRYIPDDSTIYGGEVKDSNETLIVPIADYCQNKDYQFGFSEQKPVAPYYYSPKENRFIAFDDERSLGIKFCLGKKNRTKIKYGITIYDVEMDDPTNKCGKGTYRRLKFLRKLVDYMNNNFTSESDHEECRKLITDT